MLVIWRLKNNHWNFTEVEWELLSSGRDYAKKAIIEWFNEQEIALSNLDDLLKDAEILFIGKVEERLW